MSGFAWIGSHGGVIFACLAWIIAAAWLWRILPALKFLPTVPDLCDPKYARTNLDPWPSIAVIVPAKDESCSIEKCLRSLLENSYPNLQIVAVNDRSTDGTGSIMDRAAAGAPDKLHVLHVKELPPGWLGKSHAMTIAAENIQAEWLLFTDGDVIFAPDALHRAMAFATEGGADHFVLYPTLELHGWAEHMLIAFFQCVSVFAGRPWKIPDPSARRDFIGVGAFNMIRRSAYEAIGGYSALRMEILEDMCLGQKAKSAGYAQRVAFGKDLLRIRWADSAGGMMRNLTKNLFAAFRFRVALVLCACIGMALMALVPFAALGVSGAARWAGGITLLSFLLLNLRYWKQTRISPIYLLLFPFATLLFLFTLLRSMFLALWRGGVMWRGTLYPLRDLRRHTRSTQ